MPSTDPDPFLRGRMSVNTIWVDAERVEQHVHVKIHTGLQYGQVDMPTYERRRGHRNDAGLACEDMVLREDQWLPFIKALAIGGFHTGLRVCWSEHTDDRRDLWNGHATQPCLLGTLDDVEWVKA